ncbi:MAG: hypothetical protein IT323_13675, partial [Anaerolineae bacterium]|nr:hypothetical protein [Anaerolineae bacterium]
WVSKLSQAGDEEGARRLDALIVQARAAYGDSEQTIASLHRVADALKAACEQASEIVNADALEVFATPTK